MFITVSATLPFNKPMVTEPAKSDIAAIITAFFKLMLWVDTQDTIALGASVIPFTKATAKVIKIVNKTEKLFINRLSPP